MLFQWESDPETIFFELAQEYRDQIHEAVFKVAKRYEPEIEAWMKSNAPWQDRSGNARQTLYTDVDQVVNQTVDLLMSHGVDYGRWLELIQGGSYAIIGPALDYFAPKMWADIQRLFS